MTPMKPELRQALKEAHPGLTDQVIDEYEKLTVMRGQMTAERSAEAIATIDRQREKLLRDRMPYFAQISQMVDARRRAETPPQEPKFEVRFAPPRDDGRKGS